jgi:transposase
MRRGPPRCIELPPADAAYLQDLVRDGRTEQRVARRARILLAMADPETIVQELADRVELRRETIWQLCRRYEEIGVQAVKDAPREGRPPTLSPPTTRRGRDARVLRSHRSRAADHALVDAQLGKGGS